MIDTAQGLINKLKNYYSEDVSVELEDGLKGWARKKNFSPDEFENLYEIAVENCARFPKVQLIAKLWNEQGQKISKGEGHGKAMTALHDNRDKSWQSLIDEMNDIRNSQDSRDLTCREIDLLHEFQELMDVYKMLGKVPSIIMPQKDKDTYLRKVKEDVCAGIPVKMEAVSRHMARRRKEYEQKYGAEAEEHAPVNIEHTVEDLEAVFADNAKLFQPEPDRLMI